MKMGVTLTGNRRRKHVRIFSQNCRGLKTKDRLQMVVGELENRNSFAAAVQETWRKGSEALQLKNSTMVLHGPSQQSGRGSRGVGIVLSSVATDAWVAGGSKVYSDDAQNGGRAMADELVLVVLIRSLATQY